MGKRKRYNWRARFALATDRDRQNRGTPEDTNVLELPSKARKNSEQKGIEPPRKKKKLSSRQKKHLKKVVEKKEKKAKVIRKCSGLHVFMSRDAHQPLAS